MPVAKIIHNHIVTQEPHNIGNEMSYNKKVSNAFAEAAINNGH